MPVTVAIVGGGMSGLSAAHRLKQHGIAVTLFEPEERLGGRVKTVRQDGYAFDVGAGGLLGSYAATIRLIEELGLNSALDTSPIRMAIPHAGKLHAFDMGRPIKAFVGTGLLSTRDKLSLLRLLPALVGAWRDLDFENIGRAARRDRLSYGDFARARLTPDANRLFIDTIIRCLWQRDAPPSPAIDLLWSLKHFTPTIYQVAGGMDVLPARLGADLDDRRITRVASVEASVSGVSITAEGQQGEITERFDHCIVATPPRAAARILPQLDQAVSAAMSALDYTASVNVHLGMATEIGREHRMQMILPPAHVEPDLTTAFFEHYKAPGRAPSGTGGLSFYFRDAWSRERLEAGNNSVLADVLEIAERSIPGFREQDVVTSHIERWGAATIMRSVGQTALVQRIFTARRSIPRVSLAGDYFALSGVNTAVTSGQRAAAEIIAAIA